MCCKDDAVFVLFCLAFDMQVLLFCKHSYSDLGAYSLVVVGGRCCWLLCVSFVFICLYMLMIVIVLFVWLFSALLSGSLFVVIRCGYLMFFSFSCCL